MKKKTVKFLAMTMAALLLLPGAIAQGVSQNGGLQAIAAAANASGKERALDDQLAAPERYTATAANASGTITLTADAELVIPDVDAIPVLRVEKAPITQAQVDVLVRQLVKGELCSAEAYVPSRAQLEGKLEQLQKVLDEEAAKPPATIKQRFSVQGIQSEMAELETQLEAAGDTPRLVPTHSRLVPFQRPLRYAPDTLRVSQYETGEELNALAYSEATGYETLWIINSETSSNTAVYAREPGDFSQGMGYYFASTDASELSRAIPLTVTEAQARQAAQALISALGIDYLELARAEQVVGGDSRYVMNEGPNPLRQAWLLRYTRTVEGVPTTYTDIECMKVETSDQADPILYESMAFAIDDSGIVGFQWSSPYAITKTETTSAKLLSFADCASVFETMVFPVNEWMAENGSAAIKGKRAELGMSRVTERDERGSGLIIPVWDFLGDVTITYESGGQSQEMELADWPLLTVNAITGDVIDRNLGY